MGAGNASRLTDLADDITAVDRLAFVDEDLLEVTVHRDQSLAVIDEHAVAVEEVLAHVNNATVGRCMDERPGWRRDVHAAVGFARLAVEEAAQAE